MSAHARHSRVYFRIHRAARTCAVASWDSREFWSVPKVSTSTRRSKSVSGRGLLTATPGPNPMPGTDRVNGSPGRVTKMTPRRVSKTCGTTLIMGIINYRIRALRVRRNFNIENLPHHVRTSVIFLKLFQTGISHKMSA